MKLIQNTLAGAFLLGLSLPSFAASSLSTIFNSDNGQGGIMFDVVNLGEQLNISAFDLNLTSGTHAIEVYSISDTWVGADKTPGAWTLLDTGAVTSSGVDSPSFFDVNDFILEANTSTGFYITTTSGTGIRYTVGSASGSISAANTDLQILEGAGKSYAFGVTIPDRIWNGSIYYGAVSAVPEPSTYALMLSGLGLVGFMAARRRKQA